MMYGYLLGPHAWAITDPSSIILKSHPYELILPNLAGNPETNPLTRTQKIRSPSRCEKFEFARRIPIDVSRPRTRLTRSNDRAQIPIHLRGKGTRNHNK